MRKKARKAKAKPLPQRPVKVLARPAGRKTDRSAGRGAISAAAKGLPISKTLPDADGARTKIMEVATQLFGEKGLDATTTRDIAKASGLNISLISYYFGGKVGLYKTIIYEHAVQIRENLDTIFHSFRRKELSAQTFCEEIESIVRHFVDMRLADESIAKIFMAERIQKMPYAKEVFETIMAPVAEKLVGMIRAGQAKGFLDARFPPRSFFMLMIESIFGYFMAQDCDLKIWDETYHFPADKEKFIEFVTLIFTKGMLI
jgi:AcrR family transcriptional regulator